MSNRLAPDLRTVWKGISAARAGKTPPILVKNGVYSSGVDVSDVRSILSCLRQSPELARSYLRVYVEGKQSYAHEDSIIHSPPAADEDIECWMRRVVKGSQRCGLVLNYAEQWNDELCRKIAEFLKPCLLNLTPAGYGIEINLFVGNYGYTPFGVHFDDNTTSVLHLHLGPGKKAMSVWTPERFKALTGSDRSFYQPEQIVAHGVTYEIHQGDLFLLPPGYFHVGYTEEFSVAIGVSVSRIAREDFMRASLAMGCEEILKQTSANSSDSPIFGNDLARWIDDSISLYSIQRLSALGFQEPPLVRQPPRDLKRKTVTGVLPFQLQCSAAGEVLSLAVRGTIISMKANHDIPRLIEVLNSGRKLLVSALLRDFVSTISWKALLHILKLLYMHHGIEIVE